MKDANKSYSLKFRFLNWNNFLLIAIACFYLVLFGTWVADNGFLTEYGADYLAFWSAGKIADEKGYSEIYNLENLRGIQTQALNALNSYAKEDSSSYSPIPAPYFALYILPFQLLSKVGVSYSYWIWTLLNLVVLISYLSFFLQKTNPESGAKVSVLKLLILMLIAFPVFKNIIEGQVNVLLLVCVAEFIRNADNKKTVLSGAWLAGLLLKPQMLILVVPILIIKHYWKVLIGFAVSSSVIILSSFILSGFAGIKALINLLTKYTAGIASNNPGAMINWRMVGVNLNLLLNTKLGWGITGLGIILTILSVFYLMKHSLLYGSAEWVLTMLGVFAGTLVITWHSHFHMALVLIPFLVYASMYNLVPQKIIYFWVIVTPVALIGLAIASPLILYLTKINVITYLGMVVAFSGFIVNLVILICTIIFEFRRNIH